MPNNNFHGSVIPADGANLYWYDKFGIGRKVCSICVPTGEKRLIPLLQFKIESGSQVVEKENIFEITAV